MTTENQEQESLPAEAPQQAPCVIVGFLKPCRLAMAGVELSFAEEFTLRIGNKGMAVRFLVLHQGNELVKLL